VSLVLDSCLTLTWFFEDERSALADAVLRQVAESGAVVPSLWRLEIASALQMAVRHKRIDARFRDASLADLRALPIDVDPETDRHAWAATLKLAERCRLTLYDAAYLELAQRVDLPLASLDQQLRAAAKAIGVPLRGK
jgi:predicted nucleic acid-binding protein